MSANPQENFDNEEYPQIQQQNLSKVKTPQPPTKDPTHTTQTSP